MAVGGVAKGSIPGTSLVDICGTLCDLIATLVYPEDGRPSTAEDIRLCRWIENAMSNKVGSSSCSGHEKTFRSTVSYLTKGLPVFLSCTVDELNSCKTLFMLRVA